jgi:predicted DNA-binding protein
MPDDRMVCFRMEEEDRRRLKALAAETGTTVQEVLSELAQKWMEKMEKRLEGARR